MSSSDGFTYKFLSIYANQRSDAVVSIFPDKKFDVFYL